MKYIRFTNSILSSNSYILYSDKNNYAWIIDPGDSEQILSWLHQEGKTVKGILLTHSHIDHTYGLNEICDEFPELEIYLSIHAGTILNSPKDNNSYYLEIDFKVTHSNINYVEDGNVIQLFNDNQTVKAIYTPGHNIDCLSYKVNEFLFTGDALIPGHRVHTKSRKADKDVAKYTIEGIFNNFPGNTLICAGHGEPQPLKHLTLTSLIK